MSPAFPMQTTWFRAFCRAVFVVNTAAALTGSARRASRTRRESAGTCACEQGVARGCTRCARSGWGARITGCDASESKSIELLLMKGVSTHRLMQDLAWRAHSAVERTSGDAGKRCWWVGAARQAAAAARTAKQQSGQHATQERRGGSGSIARSSSSDWGDDSKAGSSCGTTGVRRCLRQRGSPSESVNWSAGAELACCE